MFTLAPPLTAPYDGPYKVVARSGQVFKVMIKGKVETVTADRVKPAHIKRKPENDRTQQHKVTLKSKPMASKPTAKTRTSTQHCYVEALQERSCYEKEFARTVYDTDKGNGFSDRSTI